MPNLVVIDGLSVDVSNPEVADSTIRNLISARDTATSALSAAETALSDARNALAARDAEIVTLKDAAEKAKPTPAQLRDAATEYARVAAKAKALGVAITDEMDALAMQRAAVALKMGDTAAGYTDGQVSAAFDALSAIAPVDPLREFVADGPPASIGDGQKAFADARAARFARFETAHRTTAAA